MLWKRKQATVEASELQAEKLPGPKGIPEVVGRYLVTRLGQNPDQVWNLMATVRRKEKGKGVDSFDVRVFNAAQAAAKGVKVRDFTSFDDHPELILYDGWFDKKSMQADIVDRRLK